MYAVRKPTQYTIELLCSILITRRRDFHSKLNNWSWSRHRSATWCTEGRLPTTTVLRLSLPRRKCHGHVWRPISAPTSVQLYQLRFSYTASTCLGLKSQLRHTAHVIWSHCRAGQRFCRAQPSPNNLLRFYYVWKKRTRLYAFEKSLAFLKTLPFYPSCIYETQKRFIKGPNTTTASLDLAHHLNQICIRRELRFLHWTTMHRNVPLTWLQTSSNTKSSSIMIKFVIFIISTRKMTSLQQTMSSRTMKMLFMDWISRK